MEQPSNRALERVNSRRLVGLIQTLLAQSFDDTFFKLNYGRLLNGGFYYEGEYYGSEEWFKFHMLSKFERDYQAMKDSGAIAKFDIISKDLDNFNTYVTLAKPVQTINLKIIITKKGVDLDGL